MNVPHVMVTNKDDFAAALKREEWFFVFSGYTLYERIKPVMESVFFPICQRPSHKKPPSALMVEFGNEPYIPDVRFISLPVQSLSIANTLNGNADSKGYFESSGTGSTIRFSFPTARLLVVDDIATNLKVAEGLLIPYRAAVDTCLSAADAIEKVKRAVSENREYDIVFMDHMMPEMDGIEATAIIRELEGERFKTMPIIALTANAVSGMREMFIEKGFSDFLAKPIDVSKLDESLGRWIPKEKREGTKDKDSGSIKDEKEFVILVDDTPANLRQGKNILSEKYRVATAPSAAKLFGLLESNRPALILLDIDMPEMDGYAAIEVIKSKTETKDIPVIFLTEAADSREEEKSRDAGAADFVSKPFDPEALIACVEKYGKHYGK
jgi:CheY-like chemotaxis protein